MADQKSKAAPSPPPRQTFAQRTGLRRMLGLNNMPFGPMRWFLPLVLLGLVSTAVARVANLALSGPVGEAWVYPLLIAFLLGIVMSIPIVSLLAMLFGAWLIQPVLFLYAMVLLAKACWLGAVPWWFGALPALYFLVWAGQLIGGHILIWKLNRAARHFARIELAGAAPVLAREPQWPGALPMLTGSALCELWIADKPLATGYLRLRPDEVADIAELTGGQWPANWRLHEMPDGPVLQYPAPLPERAIWLQQDSWKAPFRLLSLPLSRTMVRGQEHRQLIWGRSAPILPLPVFHLFHWFGVFGEPSGWRVGFFRSKQRAIGMEQLKLDRLLAPPQDQEPLRLARLDQARRLLVQALRQRKEAVAELMLASLTDPMPRGKHGKTLTLLGSAGPALLGDDPGPPLLAWLRRARDAHSYEGVHYVARLLARLSDADLRKIVPELCTAVNSRKLLLQWTMGPNFDPAPLPPQTPVFGKKAGFGLLKEQPQLFVRMGDCYSTARTLVAELGKEMDLPSELQQALERWKTDGRGV